MKSYKSKHNIEKAWSWIKSNPDKVLKDEYGMRNSYQSFSVVDKEFLSEIVDELKNNTYKPTTSCKVYLPKPSGGLRPYSILTVKDQIVYQSIVNVIAEQLYKKTKNRYYSKIFGNLYAGEKSTWFYKKWKDGYSKFNETARVAFNSGKVYMASFDLVACYDSIDHKVLEHYLNELNVPKEATKTLLECLSTWTSTDHDERIYQGHGIPQGPMSSGLLSEVVLTAFDSEKRTNGVSYLRYVDDILFFASNENDLRFELVRMDRVCKKVGLFPQSSKINIRKVKNIDDEIKNISGVFERKTEIKDDDYFNAVKELTPSFKISDISKFRYCVVMAKPTAPLINRLWKIFEKRPDIYPQLCKVLRSSGKISKVSEKNIEKFLSKKSPYINIQASIIEVLCNVTLTNTQITKFSKIIKNDYGTGIAFRNTDSRLTSLVFEFLYKYNKLTDKQISFISTSPFWYTRREIARFLNNEKSDIIKTYLTDPVLDVQISACRNIVEKDIQIPNKKLPSVVNSYFRSNGLLTKRNSDPCKINFFLSEMLGRKVNFNWKKLLDQNYKQALQILVMCNSSKSTNISAWICELDSFNETIVRSIHGHDSALGNLPDNIGSIYKDNNRLFNSKYSSVSKKCESIHNRRVTTPTAHAFEVKTKTPTKKFKFKEMPVYLKIENLLISEIEKLVV